MKDWRDYPGRSQSVAELEKWAKGLKYFRYLAACGGHANDGDVFVARVRKGQGDVVELLTNLPFPAILSTCHAQRE
jgi:hypothetical protein